MPWNVRAVLILLAIPLLGCGSKTVPVTGRVKFKDGSDVSALAGYEIKLKPAGGGTGSYGTIELDGTFKLSTFGHNDGAVPGAHQAIVAPARPEPDKPPAAPVIPPKYGSFDTSGLVIEVKPGQGEVELELDRAP